MSEEKAQPPTVRALVWKVLTAKAQTMRGPAAVRSMFDALEESFSEIRWVPEKVIETTRGQFLAFVRMEAAGGRSQVPLRQPVAILATLKNGRFSEGDMFASRDEALKAAGLSE